jgi:AcrR family transcriptional regulator
MMDKKEQIIKIAMKLFVERGFENTPTSLISKKSKTGAGTLFHHFKSKEELINEIYVYVKKSMMASVTKGTKEIKDIKEIIRVIWYNLVKWGYENLDESRFLSKFYGSSYISNLTIDQLQEGVESVNELVNEAMKKGLIKKISPLLFERLTLKMYHEFVEELVRINKLDKNILDLSYEMYWGAFKK